MRSLVRPEEPVRVIEALIEWEQSTPAVFGSDASIALIRTPPVSEEEEDPEEDPEEDLVEVLEPMMDEGSVNGPEWTLSSEPAGGDSESSHRWRMEWLDHYYLPRRALAVKQAALAGDSVSSTAFSTVRVDVRQADRLGPSGVAAITSSSDSSSEEDSKRTDTEASSSGDLW